MSKVKDSITESQKISLNKREKKYKHQCGTSKLKIKGTETNRDRCTLVIGVVIITVLPHRGLITFIIRSHGLIVKTRGLLITLTVFIKRGWKKSTSSGLRPSSQS